MKFTIILLTMLAVIVAGCTDVPTEAEENDTFASLVEEATGTMVETETPSAEQPNLKIMSVSAEDNTIVIKIKNSGLSTAPDVYAGVVGISQYPNYSSAELAMFDGYIETLYTISFDAINGGKPYVDTGFALEYNGMQMSSLKLSGTLLQKDYVGDIQPGNVMEARVTIYGAYDNYLSVTWMDGKEAGFVLY